MLKWALVSLAGSMVLITTTNSALSKIFPTFYTFRSHLIERSGVHEAPVAAFFLAVLVAPLAEELAMRALFCEVYFRIIRHSKPSLLEQFFLDSVTSIQRSSR